MCSSVCCCAEESTDFELSPQISRGLSILLLWTKIKTEKKKNRLCLSGDCQLKSWKQFNVFGFLVMSVVDVLLSDGLEAYLCIYASEIP